MSENNSNNILDVSSSLNTVELSRIKYGILQIGQVFSFPVYLFVCFHILGNKIQRNSLNNHVILVLLLFNFLQLIFDMSLVLAWLQRGTVQPGIPATCYFWNFINYWAYYNSFLIMLWAALERHMLVFHAHLVRTKRGRLLFHYQPLALLLMYSTIYYVYFIFFYPCQNEFDYTIGWCGFMCYSNVAPSWLYLYEYLAHEIIPMFLEAFLSVLLILRVVLQKRRMRQQAAEWRKNRKMVLQLLGASFVSVVFNMPDVISPLGRLIFGIQLISDDVQVLILNYVGYGTCIFLPFICLIAIPHLKEKLKTVIDYRRWPGRVNNQRDTVIGTRMNVVGSRR